MKIEKTFKIFTRSWNSDTMYSIQNDTRIPENQIEIRSKHTELTTSKAHIRLYTDSMEGKFIIITRSWNSDTMYSIENDTRISENQIEIRSKHTELTIRKIHMSLHTNSMDRSKFQICHTNQWLEHHVLYRKWYKNIQTSHRNSFKTYRIDDIEGSHNSLYK